MTRRKVLKLTPVLVTLNILVLLLMIVFYGYRMIKYYKIEHSTGNGNNGIVLLYNTVARKQKYVDLTNGLIFNEEDNNYYYKGSVDDNYLLYSGMLFRIIGIDNENNVRAVSDKSVTLLYSGLEKGFNDSYVNKWLNKTDVKYSGIFESELYSTDILESTYLCSDKIDDANNITCNDVNMDNKISLLSLYDYKLSGGKSGFLNNGENYYLGTINNDGNNYYVTNTGEVALNQIYTKTYGVRPVISFNITTQLLSGKGTKDDPYIVERHDINTLNDVYVNNFIKIDNNTYKVVAHNKEGVKVVQTNALVINEKELNSSFGSTSKYSINITLGKYLNSTYYNSITTNGSIVASTWFVGENSLNNLDYTAVYTAYSKAYIGLLGLGDLFMNEVNNVFTLSRGIESSKIINIINESGNFYGDEVSSKHNVRVSFVLNKDIKIESGNGSEKSPYVLGGLDEKEE